MAKDVLYATFDTEANFVPVNFEETNPSFHTSKIRIMGINKIANNVKFSHDSTVDALPTLKNIPIVTLYKKDEQNFGDHEMHTDVTGVRYGTYPIGVIPESANQWIEPVHNQETGETELYLCSDALLWKRMKDEFSLIKSQGSFSVSMEVGMVDYEFNANKVCEVKEFYFTGIAVLGNGVKPAFKDACVNFQAQSDFQEMMFELNEYMKQFEGGQIMPSVEPKKFENEEQQAVEPNQEPTVEPQQEPEQPQQQEQKQEQEPQPNNEAVEGMEKEIEGLKVEKEKLEADYGRLQAELKEIKEQAQKELEEYKVAKEEEINALKSELDELRNYRTTTEAEIRKNARKAVESKLMDSFPELADVEDYKNLIANEELSAQDLEDKAYALVGRMEREKRDNKRVKTPTPTSTTRVPITNSPKNKKSNSPYGGLLLK